MSAYVGSGKYGERATYAPAPRDAPMALAVELATLEIYQGDDYGATVEVFDDGSAADLTGVTAKAQVRTAVADLQPVVAAEIGCTITLPNIITLDIPHADTAGLNGPYVWDLQLTLADGIIVTILAGSVVATPEVTRA